MADQRAIDQSRLRWQCRRGMRELDQLLLGYLETGFAVAGQREKSAFCALLELPDPELIGYLLGGQTPADPVLANVVRRICNRPPA